MSDLTVTLNSVAVGFGLYASSGLVTQVPAYVRSYCRECGCVCNGNCLHCRLVICLFLSGNWNGRPCLIVSLLSVCGNYCFVFIHAGEA